MLFSHSLFELRGEHNNTLITDNMNYISEMRNKLWHVDPLLFGDREISDRTMVIARQRHRIENTVHYCTLIIFVGACLFAKALPHNGCVYFAY